jgi:hypothetical protein
MAEEDESIGGSEAGSSLKLVPSATVVNNRWRPLKLVVSWLWLATLTVAAAVTLAFLGAVDTAPGGTVIIGATARLNRLWLLAAVGGLLGGSIRGVFMLIVENYAFEHRRRTGITSEWAHKILAERCGLKTVDDKLDPLTNWWAYPLKPIMGMGFGFVFGLLQLLGLIPFLAPNGSSADTAVVVVSSLAGILTEEALSKLQGLFRGGGTTPVAGASEKGRAG